MHVIDVNVLVYASDEGSPDHAVARAWLDAALDGAETVAFPWLVLIAFVRLVTHPRAARTPMAIEEAMDQVDLWLRQPAAAVVSAGPRHSSILRELLMSAGTAGNLTNDAHLAALAIENGGDVVSFDRDFARFRGVRWTVPTPQ